MDFAAVGEHIAAAVFFEDGVVTVELESVLLVDNSLNCRSNCVVVVEGGSGTDSVLLYSYCNGCNHRIDDWFACLDWDWEAVVVVEEEFVADRHRHCSNCYYWCKAFLGQLVLVGVA